MVEQKKQKTAPARYGLESTVDRDISPAEQRANIADEAFNVEAIRTAILNKTQLMNKCASVKTITNGNVRTPALCLRYSKNIRVLIPFEYAFQDVSMLKIDATSDDKVFQKKRNILKRMLGDKSNIMYIPESIDYDAKEDIYTVIGNRKASLEIDREKYYIGPDANLKSGQVYNAKVVFANSVAALICLGGVEKIVPKKDLTNRYITQVDAWLHPGDRIPVAVRSIDVNDKKEVSVFFDMLSGEISENRSGLSFISPGDVVYGTISRVNIDKDNKDNYALIAWIDEYDVPAKINGIPLNRFGFPAKVGDTVELSVKEVEKNGYVRGYITAFLGREY